MFINAIFFIFFSELACNSDSVYGSLEISDKCMVICLLDIRNQIRGPYLIWGPSWP